MANINLAIIPDNWDLNYKTGPQLIHLDTSIIHNSSPSIRLDPHTSADLNPARECDIHWPTFWPMVKPGDHIIAKVWIRVLTGPSTTRYPQCGGRILIDFYGASGLLPATTFWSNYYNGDFANSYIHDTNGGIWQQKVIDIVVPATVGDSNGNPQLPTVIALSLQAAPWDIDPTATPVWFADAELYINPSTPVSQQTLTIVPSTVGGTTDPAPGAYTVNAGSIFPVRNIAATGYQFKTWILDGADQDPWWHLAETINITMSTDHVIQAVFEPVSQPAPPSQGGGGATAFLLVIGGVTVFGLALGLTSGKKRIQRRRRR